MGKTDPALKTRNCSRLVCKIDNITVTLLTLVFIVPSFFTLRFYRRNYFWSNLKQPFQTCQVSRIWRDYHAFFLPHAFTHAKLVSQHFSRILLKLDLISMQLWFSYASCGILLILNQGYTDQTCVMSKVFVDLVEIFRATLRQIKR